MSEPITETECKRCPQRFRTWHAKAQTLCADCRYVLPAEMQEAWAA
ncbi:hypothetical protein ICM05_09765 [Leucobacter sp. cx-42]|nr:MULTISPECIES: hypothetical protein [unclassified Leucobacter]MBC9954924.1 hypothetical protein [Leucobacter sp. cx-42]